MSLEALAVEQRRAAHVAEVLQTFDRLMARAPAPESLVYATGLLLGVRSCLGTLEEYQRWGACAAALLRAVFAAYLHTTHPGEDPDHA